MLFNTLAFLVFFIVVTGLYFLIPHRFRWFLLLAASCYFYMFFVPIYILILAFTIVIDYFAGILIENASGRRRKWFLVISLISNIGVLGIFKYYNFFAENANEVFSIFNLSFSLPYLSILLPIGLSFHTFQAMSYTIEVFRGHQAAERNFGIYALYVMFYPQLVAGPIERPQNLLKQFYEKHQFDWHRVIDGVKLMLWGLFKKAVIADRVAFYVNEVYNDPHHHKGFALIIATFFFAIQIYCDFSGYSDMAIGAAKVMGFKLIKNFDRPYFSKSISEFWKRWHISLSTWFKDYLYLSLGGNRVSVPRWYFNLFFVFLVSGIWHGANWTFFIWGALNGIYLIVEMFWLKPLVSGLKWLGIRKDSFWGKLFFVLFTFLLVDFAWIFFRANSLSDALYIIAHIPSGLGATAHLLSEKAAYFILVGIFLLIEYVQRFRPYSPSLVSATSIWEKSWNIAVYSFFVWSIIVFGEFGSKEFIYFQF